MMHGAACNARKNVDATTGPMISAAMNGAIALACPRTRGAGAGVAVGPKSDFRGHASLVDDRARRAFEFRAQGAAAVDLKPAVGFRPRYWTQTGFSECFIDNRIVAKR